MRISRRFNLGRTQPTLDFVDVDTGGDTPLFLSPRALGQLPSPWGAECVHRVQHFFAAVLRLIRSGDDAAAERLLSALREPNETHLGLSSGRSRGRALGDESAHRVWDALRQSEAVKSGLLKDLEDTVLLIEGIGVDIVSDITTNLIRGPLIRYTQQACQIYGIPLKPGIASGPIWDPQKSDWTQDFVDLPVTPEGKLLLVPKSIVRRTLVYQLEEYFRHHLLVEIQREEFAANTGLVRILKDGTRKPPSKVDLIDKYGSAKVDIVRETLKRPNVFEEYKRTKDSDRHLPLEHDQIATAENTPLPDWDLLIGEVTSRKVGNDEATIYEKRIESLLSALFYPDLTTPIPQERIHDGRKRVDITYTNMGVGPFFNWLAAHYTCPSIFVECKNYGKELGNPELDQMAGRFSPSRGRVGLIVCRSFEDKVKFLKRCRDTVHDDRGFILPLDDDDLIELTASVKAGGIYDRWPLLRERFRFIVS